MTNQKNQDVVSFQGVDILTFSENNNHYIAVKPLCETFGIAWQTQHRKLTDDDLFSSVITTMVTTGADGKQYEMTCLPLEAFPMWLARINTSRVEDPFAARMILAFQQEATQVLYEHFLGTPEAHKKELERKDEAIRAFAAKDMNSLRGKIFRDHQEYWTCQQVWRLRSHYESFREVAKHIDRSASSVSSRYKKYQHYIDATLHNRKQDLPDFRADAATAVELYRWMSPEFEDYAAFLRALERNDRRFHEANRYAEQYRQHEDKIHGGGRDA